MGIIALWTLAGIGLTYVIVDAFLDDDDDEGSDAIVGTPGDDVLRGGEGDDTIIGQAGDDLLTTVAGTNVLRGDEGDDIAIGGEDDDILRGAEGDDLLVANGGPDTVFGDRGDDWVEGGGGIDEVAGGPDSDIVIGGQGPDELTGGNGQDILFNGNFLERSLTEDELLAVRDALQAGEEVVFPEDAQPLINDDGNADVMDAGSGDDILFVGDGDTATGGGGDDTFFLLDRSDTVDPASVTDFETGSDALVYVYPAGGAEPTITIDDNEDGTQTVLANDQVVAIVASSQAITVDDITLFERDSDPNGLI